MTATKAQERVTAGVLILSACFVQLTVHRPEKRLAEGEHYAELNGIRLWYKVAGNGPLIVIQSPGSFSSLVTVSS
jgi:hypothetical protein